MTAPYRVLVTGSRTWTDADTVFGAFLDALPDPIQAGRHYVFVHGDCPDGPDSLVEPFCDNEAWWVDNSGAALYAEPHPADWDRCAPGCKPSHRCRRRDGSTYCPAAGLRRDAEMVRLGADLCLAFIDPCAKPDCRKPKPHGSHGASHTADLAERAGIPVKRWAA